MIYEKKDFYTKNICIYKDLLSGIQGLVSAYWLLLYPFTKLDETTLFLNINYCTTINKK